MRKVLGVFIDTCLCVSVEAVLLSRRHHAGRFFMRWGKSVMQHVRAC